MATTTHITPEMIEAVLRSIVDGVPVRQAAVINGCHYPTMMLHISADAALYARYQRARAIRAHGVVDEIVPIADEVGDPAHLRVRVEARKQYAQLVNPREYGARLDVNIDDKPLIRVALEEARRRRERLLSMRDQHDEHDAQAIDAQYEVIAAPTDSQSVEDDLAALFGDA